MLAFISKILKKFIPLTLASLLLLGVFSFSGSGCGKKKVRIVAITQITSHQSLDLVHQGIVDALEAKGYKDRENLKITFSNAQGDIGTAVQIAHRFVAMKPDVIVAIATPSAQAIVNAVGKQDIPVVFASITDPIAANLVNTLEAPGGNVTGTRNTSPIGKQIDLLKQIFPKIKRMGVVLNFAEDNSVALLKEVEKESKKQGIRVETAAVSNSSEVPEATRKLVADIDVIFLILDNTVASAEAPLIKIATEHGIPVFSTHMGSIEHGALAEYAFDEHKIGIQTGEIVIRILEGERPGNIPVQDPQKLKLVINEKVAKKLGIMINLKELKDLSSLFLIPNSG